MNPNPRSSQENPQFQAQKSLPVSGPLPPRDFFRRMGGLTAAASALNLPAALQLQQARAAASQPGAASNLRRNQAYQTRQQAAMSQMQQPLSVHTDNGDESLFPNKIG